MKNSDYKLLTDGPQLSADHDYNHIVDIKRPTNQFFNSDLSHENKFTILLKLEFLLTVPHPHGQGLDINWQIILTFLDIKSLLECIAINKNFLTYLKQTLPLTISIPIQMINAVIDAEQAQCIERKKQFLEFQKVDQVYHVLPTAYCFRRIYCVSGVLIPVCIIVALVLVFDERYALAKVFGIGLGAAIATALIKQIFFRFWGTSGVKVGSHSPIDFSFIFSQFPALD